MGGMDEIDSDPENEYEYTSISNANNDLLSPFNNFSGDSPNSPFSQRFFHF